MITKQINGVNTHGSLKQITTGFSKRIRHLTPKDKEAVKGMIACLKERGEQGRVETTGGRIKYAGEIHLSTLPNGDQAKVFLVTRTWKETSATLGRKIERFSKMSFLLS